MTASPGPLLLRGDARALPLSDGSVDLVCTSPPYFGQRDYGTDEQIGAEPTPAEFLAALLACTAEMVRVLRPSGSIFVNLGDKYAGSGGHAPNAPSQVARRAGAASVFRGAAVEHERQSGAGSRGARWGLPAKSLAMIPERYRIRCVDELGLTARAVIVWDKPNGLPESVTDRVRRSHEDWVHLTKRPKYYAAVDEIREAHAAQQTGAAGTFARKRSSHDLVPGQSVRQHREDRPDVPAYSSLGKLPGSVWSIATQPLRVPAELNVDHFAAFPMEWPRRLITGWCPPGGVVLDPFGGTGTTALVAHMLGRAGISVDLSADYQRIAQWRRSDPRERGRAAGLDQLPGRPPPPDQLSLLDEESA